MAALRLCLWGGTGHCIGPFPREHPLGGLSLPAGFRHQVIVDPSHPAGTVDSTRALGTVAHGSSRAASRRWRVGWGNHLAHAPRRLRDSCLSVGYACIRISPLFYELPDILLPGHGLLPNSFLRSPFISGAVHKKDCRVVQFSGVEVAKAASVVAGTGKAHMRPDMSALLYWPGCRLIEINDLTCM